MKGKKWIALACVGLLCTMLLSGCSLSTPLPDGFDEQEIIAAAAEIRDLVFAGNYEEVTARFREDVRTEQEITTAKVKTLVETYANPEDIGTFKKVNKTTVSGNNEGEEHGIVVFECEFTSKKVGIGISFDRDMQLLGLTVGRE